MTAALLAVPDPVERDDLAGYCARVVRLDPIVAIRMRTTGGEVAAWAPTPFDVLATHTVTGRCEPGDVTVPGSDLLAALSVVGGPSVDPGTPCDERWRSPLPGATTWTTVGEVPVAEVDELAVEGIAAGQGRPVGRLPADLLDRIVLTLPADGTGGVPARVPMRCLLALAGLGLLATGERDATVVRVATGGSAGHDWVRVEARGGAVVRRRRPTLVLDPV